MKEKPVLKAERPTQCRVAIVTSLFNVSVTSKLKAGAVERFAELGFQADDMLMIDVPGAVEIPVTVKSIAARGLADVIVVFGAVIRGETSHYDYVCDQVSQGCQQVALAHQIPVIFGILTTDTMAQALARAGGEHGHKGREAADCAVHMRGVFEQLIELS